MRPFGISSFKAGITRLRSRGGASADALYDALNCYITAARTIVIRPGTTKHNTVSLAGTKGLMPHNGKFYVFSHEPVTIADPNYECIALRHPTNPVLTIREIHFASPYMNAPYVVAEFIDGSIYHYWIENLTEWLANTSYDIGYRVYPTTPNGFAYEAMRLEAPNPQWSPSVPRAIGDRVEPTTYNGFYYEVIDVEGDNPASGLVEPTWPTEDGAIVYEDTEGTTVNYGDTPGSDGTGSDTPSGEGDYSNPGGTRPNSGAEPL